MQDAIERQQRRLLIVALASWCLDSKGKVKTSNIFAKGWKHEALGTMLEKACKCLDVPLTAKVENPAIHTNQVFRLVLARLPYAGGY
jgi:hypothetical protein